MKPDFKHTIFNLNIIDQLKMKGDFFMKDRKIIFSLIEENINEMSSIIDQLYITSNCCTKNQLLNILRKKTSNFLMLIHSIDLNDSASSPTMAIVQDVQRNGSNHRETTDNTRIFSPMELAKYNGKNGNPAYVAVNGIVYDVTDSAAWGGASHFGLTAGMDVTNEFASCHAGQPILNQLKVVGKMSG
jgi:predicted heme/steroid binding protein